MLLYIYILLPETRDLYFCFTNCLRKYIKDVYLPEYSKYEFFNYLTFLIT